ncbi:hypothetical protein ACNUDM_08295 [Vibrio chaetopteri]|uniref:hypothetical protein n=1 Tax=Vibrio chaetopteri TaxID=3016528 RepID=UPI003AB62DB2
MNGSSSPQGEIDDSVSAVEVNRYESKYKTAQFVSQLISGFGWFIFACGILIILIGLDSGSGRYGFNIWQAIAAATPGFVTLVSGLFLVASGQVMRATIDNADHTNQILSHLKQEPS